MATPTTATTSHQSLKRVFHPALYAIALVFAFIEFVITAVLVSDYNRNFYPNNSIRDKLRFLLFASCWSLIFIPIYLLANLKAPGQTVSSVASNLAFVSLTWLFWLVGAAAWTDALGGTLHCGDIFLLRQTIDISVPYCHSLRAAQAFAWMLFITFTAALAYVLAMAFRSRKREGGLKGPMQEVTA